MCAPLCQTAPSRARKTPPCGRKAPGEPESPVVMGSHRAQSPAFAPDEEIRDPVTLLPGRHEAIEQLAAAIAQVDPDSGSVAVNNT